MGTGSFHPNELGQAAFFRAFTAQYGTSAATGGNPISEDVTVQMPREFLGRPNLSLAEVRVLTGGGAEITYVGATSDRDLTITTTGFEPGSSVFYELRSDPVSLGTAVADADGTAVLAATIPSDVPPGFHSVLVSGLGADGTERVGIVSLVLLGDRPTAAEDAAVGSAGTDIVIDVLAANDSDADGDSLLVFVDVQPTDGIVFVGDAGSLVFHPTSDLCGDRTFTYVTFDGQQYSEPATVTVTVNCDPSDVVVAVDDVATTDEDVAVDIDVLSNDSPGAGLDLASLSITQPLSGSVEVLADGGLRFMPEPDASGSVSITYEVCDVAVSCDSAEVVVLVRAVNDPPEATDDLLEVVEDTSVSVDVLANDNDVDGDALELVSVSEASDGVAAIVDGAVAYTPAADWCGSDEFGYSVADPDGLLATAMVFVLVGCVPDAPLALDDVSSTDEDVPVVIGVLGNDSDVDGDLDAGSVSIVELPSFGSVQVQSDAALLYSPAGDAHGTDSFVYEVCDVTGLCDTASVTVEVRPVNDAPVAAGDEISTPEDMAAVVEVLANDVDVDGDTLSVEIMDAPAEGSVEVLGDGTVRYTPGPDFNGSDEFSYQVCDVPGQCDDASVSVIVEAVNDAPVANADAYLADSGVELLVEAPGVLTNDIDVDGDPLVAVLVDVPPFGDVVLADDGGFSFTTALGECGLASFTYSASDATESSVPVDVTVDVGCVDEVPVAVDDSAVTDEDTAVTVGVLVNDSDDVGLNVGSLRIVTAPVSGDATAVDGAVIYTPEADYAGADSFTYEVCDSSAQCSTATVTIDITPINDPPTANDDAADTIEDQAITIAVLDNDTDVDSDVLAPVITTEPTIGGAVVNDDGTIGYTPSAGFCGSDMFGYVAFDGLDESAEATVTVGVGCVNEPPVAKDDQAATDEDVAVDIDALGNDSDDDGLADLMVSIATPPDVGDATVTAEGLVRYAPAPDWSGVATFEYELCDASGLCDTATVTVTVTPINDAPVCDPLVADAVVGETITIPTSCSDVDGDDLTIGVDGVPATVTVEVTNEGIVFNGNEPGAVSFSYVASDGEASSDPVDVIVTLSDVATLTWEVTKADLRMARRFGGTASIQGQINDPPQTCERLAMSVNGQLVFDATTFRIRRNCIAISRQGIVNLSLRTGRIKAALILANGFELPRRHRNHRILTRREHVPGKI